MREVPAHTVQFNASTADLAARPAARTLAMPGSGREETHDMSGQEVATIPLFANHCDAANPVVL